MRAVVFAGEGRVRVDDVAEPEIKDPGDAIVAVRKTAICGSDLHVVQGKTPGMRAGAVIGHEFVGRVTALGDGVTKHWEESRVLGSFLIACGECAACAARRFNFCHNRRALGLGALNGDLDGAQAELVRVPNADVNLRALDGALSGLSDEQALFAGDILATGLYAASISGISSGETVAVIGAGPVGLMCAAAARRQGAGRVLLVDMDPARVAFAEKVEVEGIAAPDGDAAAAVAAATGGALADVALDAVGAVPAFKSALKSVRQGGRVTVVGVYGMERYELALGRAWLSGLTIRFSGMANVQGTWDDALFAVAKEELDPTKLITHRLGLEEAEQGYELFASRTAMKVVLTP